MEQLGQRATLGRHLCALARCGGTVHACANTQLQHVLDSTNVCWLVATCACHVEGMDSCWLPPRFL